MEAVKLAFEDSLKYVTNEEKMKINIEDLLSESYAEVALDLGKGYKH